MGRDACFHFVLATDAGVSPEEARHLDVDTDWRRFTEGGQASWIVQTYAILAQSGRLDVSIGRELRPDAINVAHASHLARLWPRPARFVVCIRGDYRAVPWAGFHIVQNQRQAGDKEWWLPLWPQPGLVGRSRRRRGVETVAFAGRPYYLAGRQSEWVAALARVGCSFRVLSSHRWNDLSDVDVLLAIRSFDKRSWDNKPPSKLVNAWLAGIPLIAGADSAYDQIGRGGVDYLQVQSMDEAVAWVDRLRLDPDRYDAIVTAGTERARAFTREAIAMTWETVLAERLIDEFANWRSGRRRAAVVPALWGGVCCAWRLARSCLPLDLRRAWNANFPR